MIDTSPRCAAQRKGPVNVNSPTLCLSIGAPGEIRTPDTDTQKLAQIGTDLSTKDESTQERLINWGYANCDAALRGHFDTTLALAPKFPFARGVS